MNNQHSFFSMWLKKNPLWNLKSCELKKIQSELFVAEDCYHNPLCIFEVSENRGIPNLLLEKIADSAALKLPSYQVICSLGRKEHKIPNRPILDFTVTKITPVRRYVGNMNSNQFTRFLSATIGICKSLKKGSY